jgi:hypothetical protein
MLNIRLAFLQSSTYILVSVGSVPFPLIFRSIVYYVGVRGGAVG